MKKFAGKEDLARTVEIATIMQELNPDEQRDVLNIFRGYGLAKGVAIMPREPEPKQNNKSA